jgi:mannose-6-phosphate isomerase-like protein (cupin superfamily)
VLVPGRQSQVMVNHLNVHRNASRVEDSPADMKSDRCFRSLLENDRVRVFRVEIAPRSATSIDTHHHDYLLISLGKSKVEVSGPGSSFPLEMDDGEMQVINGGWSHQLKNESDEKMRLIEVEVQRDVHPGRAVCGLTARECTDGRFEKTDSGTYTQSTLFETDTVSLARVQLGPGGPLPSHSHHRPHVMVALDEAQLQEDSAISRTLHLNDGEAFWFGPDVTHVITNTGKQDVRLLTLELK